MSTRVGACVSYCSNERRFIVPLLEQLLEAGVDRIAVAHGSHLYDGTPEPGAPEDVARRFPGVMWCRYAVEAGRDLSSMPGVIRRPVAYWHNLARATAVEALRGSVDMVLLLDADEVPDGPELKRWLRSAPLEDGTVYKIACYWYFKDPRFRAVQLQDSVVLAPMRLLSDEALFDDMERDAIARVAGAACERMKKGPGGAVMFHHFSWVRGREGIDTKLRTWAHRSDTEGFISAGQIAQHMYRSDAPNDLINRYEYTVVEDRFGIASAGEGAFPEEVSVDAVKDERALFEQRTLSRRRRWRSSDDQASAIK